MQLAAWAAGAGTVVSDLRNAQLAVTQLVSNTAFVTAMDAGDRAAGVIHPPYVPSILSSSFSFLSLLFFISRQLTHSHVPLYSQAFIPHPSTLLSFPPCTCAPLLTALATNKLLVHALPLPLVPNYTALAGPTSILSTSQPSSGNLLALMQIHLLFAMHQSTCTQTHTRTRIQTHTHTDIHRHTDTHTDTYAHTLL